VNSDQTFRGAVISNRHRLTDNYVLTNIKQRRITEVDKSSLILEQLATRSAALGCRSGGQDVVDIVPPQFSNTVIRMHLRCSRLNRRCDASVCETLALNVAPDPQQRRDRAHQWCVVIAPILVKTLAGEGREPSHTEHKLDHRQVTGATAAYFLAARGCVDRRRFSCVAPTEMPRRKMSVTCAM
jgi:hypothetical protein